MARLPYLSADDLPPADRELLDRPINLARVLAHSPAALRSVLFTGMGMRTSRVLDPRLRELAILQVAVATQSSYEFSHHVAIGRDVGVSAEDVWNVFGETAGRTTSLSELERTVLLAARELTSGPALHVRTWNALAVRLRPDQLVDLVLVISFYTQIARVAGALQIDVEPEYLPFLADYAGSLWTAADDTDNAEG